MNTSQKALESLINHLNQYMMHYRRLVKRDAELQRDLYKEREAVRKQLKYIDELRISLRVVGAEGCKSVTALLDEKLTDARAKLWVLERNIRSFKRRIAKNGDQIAANRQHFAVVSGPDLVTLCGPNHKDQRRRFQSLCHIAQCTLTVPWNGRGFTINDYYIKGIFNVPNFG